MSLHKLDFKWVSNILRLSGFDINYHQKVIKHFMVLWTSNNLLTKNIFPSYDKIISGFHQLFKLRLRSYSILGESSQSRLHLPPNQNYNSMSPTNTQDL